MDNEQFKLLVQNTQYALLATIQKMIFNTEAARDIAQEAYLKIWENQHQINPEGKTESLLFKIAINKSIDFLRIKKNRNTPLDLIEPVSENEFDAHENQSSRLLQKVLKHAATLKPKQQICFILRDVEGYRLADIADILELNEQAVRSNLHYARQKMQLK